MDRFVEENKITKLSINECSFLQLYMNNKIIDKFIEPFSGLSVIGNHSKEQKHVEIFSIHHYYYDIKE